MKIVLVLLGSTLLFAEQPITIQECLHAKYGHTVGGTLHSKKILEKRLLHKAQQTLPYTSQEVSIMIEKKYPSLHIRDIHLTLKNCKTYYQGEGEKKSYYFDTQTLALISKEKK